MTLADPVDPLAPAVAPRAQPDLVVSDAPQITEAAMARNRAIDVIRLIAAAGIVFVHAVKSPSMDGLKHFCRFAVPFYLFASLYFQSLSLRRRNDRTLSQYLVSRVKRLYLPFLAWSLIYLIARDVKRVAILHQGLARVEIGVLWKGIEYHLWFLPFLLGFSIILALIHWGFLRQNRAWRWPLIILAILAGFGVAYAHMPSSWDEVFDNPTYAYVQFWRSMPAACWGLAFAWFMTMGPVAYSVPPLLGWAGVALTLVCSIKQAFSGIQLIPRALTGLGAILAALMPWRGSAVSVLAALGQHSYGVYLNHVLVVEIIRVALSRLHLEQSISLELGIFVLGFSASLAVVLALSRSPRLAWLNG